MSHPQRSKKFIDARVQGALARRIVFHWAVFLMIGLLASFMLQVVASPFRPFAEHVQNLWWTHGPFLLVLVFLLPVFIIDIVKISHSFAGPIFNLRRTMRSVAQGETPRPLKFRSSDFWQDLADDYNAMLTRLAPSGESAGEPPAATAQREPVNAGK